MKLLLVYTLYLYDYFSMAHSYIATCTVHDMYNASTYKMQTVNELVNYLMFMY